MAAGNGSDGMMATTKKPNVLGGALASMSKPSQLEPSTAAYVVPPADVDDDDRPVGVIVRLPPADHRAVSAFARDRNMSLQEFVENAINVVFKAEGLAPIVGMPRPKGRRPRRG